MPLTVGRIRMSLYGKSFSLCFIYDHSVLQDNVAHVKFNDLTSAISNLTSPKLCSGSCTLMLQFEN